jgi:tRNA nucleotidyltransferase/poly(A) polymerase
MPTPPAGDEPANPAENALLDAALEIVREIRGRGHAAVVVGGAVRDLVMGRPLTDVDIATDMPLAALARLYRTHAVGRSKQFDTVVVARDGRAFEVSRFRRGPTASPASGFDPLREDTAHRDFTINALALEADGRVVDFQGGLEDLHRRVIRAVGSPRERFAEDPARILRAVRFAACLGFTIEENTAGAIASCAPQLASVAGERIGGEVLKMAAQPGGALADATALMDHFGLLGMLLPEVRDLQGLLQPADKHPEGDAWQHTLAALRASGSSDPAVNLAVLFHDIGKRSAHVEEDGRHRYHGHESAGAALAETVCRRLALPQRVRAPVVFAVEHHREAGRFAELRRSTRLTLLGSEHWPALRALALCDVAARGDAGAVARLESVFREAEEDAAGSGDRLPGAAAISGTRIMELTGLSPGPRVGEIRRRVCAWALDNRIEDRERIEAAAVRLAAEGAPDP